MKNARTMVMVAALSLGALLSVATSVDPPETETWDSTWMVKNLYDGQTGVPVNTVIELSVGRRDFDTENETDPDEALASISLVESESRRAVEFTIECEEEGSVLIPVRPLEPDTEYELSLSSLSSHLVVHRIFPGLIRFSTRSRPYVTGVWQNEATLIISFSEPMDPKTVLIHQTSVDIMWEEGGELRSIAADRNLADFVFKAEGSLFMVAPLNLEQPFWVKVGGGVRSAAGIPLDGDADGIAGEQDDDFIQLYEPYELPVCYSREDIPEPCFSEDFIPDFF